MSGSLWREKTKPWTYSKTQTMGWSWRDKGAWGGLSSPESVLVYFKVILKNLHRFMVSKTKGSRMRHMFSSHSCVGAAQVPSQGQPTPISHVLSRDSHAGTNMNTYTSFLAWFTLQASCPL